jgi:hypothetical protein
MDSTSIDRIGGWIVLPVAITAAAFHAVEG